MQQQQQHTHERRERDTPLYLAAMRLSIRPILVQLMCARRSVKGAVHTHIQQTIPPWIIYPWRVHARWSQ